MYAGNNYNLYKDYNNLTVTNIGLASVIDTNPDVPQGIVANVQGVIKYKDCFQGSFTGILEKVNGKWMIDSMKVTVPPDKIECS